ncbi:5-methyltetrahydropteroyltriglutamate--homocysteine S-methyltransferase [Aquabacterium sp. A7-Y]|uniref:5-methyltetrahydropteroyltriglutamate-- homocysteine S-methyltransferase n=1 Tax=Aquabacterium sp. A7-Y TaxID=1349605 RepID=UPI00223C9D92|nr:5-methyltetrahydropteroyltriglutamate--homocysteine S-methyltransferase [Aquabacterium sp. A7-Y]MCW7539828.1 5-methyltetrahydropteroyltriglutamate--homocysteine S-methyltransferase [Aquabacterium sp. A7-Y]
MALTHILGYPRIGERRELKFALESYWQGQSALEALELTCDELAAQRWRRQRDAGTGWLTAGDFAAYDLMLDHALMFGAVPARFGLAPAAVGLAESFALARGTAQQPALEMTKWFDTNYHYLVPELAPDQRFSLHASRYLAQVDAALATGGAVKPVLIGPLTFLRLSKLDGPGERLALLPQLLEVYAELLETLHRRGIEWVQLDEPVLVTDLETAWQDAFEQAYARLAVGPRPRLLLATYFGPVLHHLPLIGALPVDGLHVDLVRGASQLGAVAAALPSGRVLSAGVIDGRNIWRTDLRRVLKQLQPLQAELGDRLWIAPSCSLLHVPCSLAHENRLEPQVRRWLAFADEKLGELEVLRRALVDGEDSVQEALAESDASLAARRHSRLVTNDYVTKRLASVDDSMARRTAPFAERIVQQRQALQLPLLPTTTIGSFPQTPEIRAARAAHRRGELGAFDYLQAMRREIRHAVEQQENLGLDVLVHGEPERNDMVEHFAEHLFGFGITENGWVQSYGSRCVKPPIIYGDVYRPEAMTVDTTRYAQSLTSKPVKGMLTGPVTLLQWSFVRDDQPREQTARQLALAIRDEVSDLEKAGIRIIQIDEPAFREGLPLRREDWPAYLDWAVNAFRLAACGVADGTQIHTHMCYSEFNDILPAIAALDADVITIETSRSRMELLDGFGAFAYPNEIGPGVYDIHSPRVPGVEEMQQLLDRACQVVDPRRLWVNPDCGLKTRRWTETMAALRHMVEAAKAVRARLTEEAVH